MTTVEELSQFLWWAYRAGKGSIKRILIGSLKARIYMVIGTISVCLTVPALFFSATAGLIVAIVGNIFIGGALYQVIKTYIRYQREIPN